MKRRRHCPFCGTKTQARLTKEQYEHHLAVHLKIAFRNAIIGKTTWTSGTI